MVVYMTEKTAGLEQIQFDSASKYDKVKDAIGSDLSLWNLNAQLLTILTSLVTIAGVGIIVVPFSGCGFRNDRRKAHA